KLGTLGTLGAARASGASFEAESTSHMSVVDAAGDIVSLTSSIESAFGARIMAAGFLLNNQLTDFSFRPGADGALVANRVQPGKRPRSSMTPVIVFDGSRQPIIAIGSPGGPLIISYVARALVEVLARGATLQAAVDLPHVANRNGATELERGTSAESLATGLGLLGHRTRTNDMTSGLHGFERVKGPRGELFWRSGIDPRREGAARGD
ncbi:MAG: gamma-glutamyltransferase, partial [Burkholderiales bacterium]